MGPRGQLGFDLTLAVRTQDGRNCELLIGYSLLGVTVPAGSKSDGASIPRLLWVIYPPFGRYWVEAFTHDYLYKYSNWTEKQCDTWLLRAMLAVGADRTRPSGWLNQIKARLAAAWWKFTCYAFYFALRAFGFIAFRQDREKAPG